MVSEAPESPDQRAFRVLGRSGTGSVALPFYATWTLDGPAGSPWVPSADAVIVPLRVGAERDASTIAGKAA